MKANTLTPELLYQIDGYWRAANYCRSARFTCVTTRC
jgi:hypothetical protein